MKPTVNRERLNALDAAFSRGITHNRRFILLTTQLAAVSDEMVKLLNAGVEAGSIDPTFGLDLVKVFERMVLLYDSFTEASGAIGDDFKELAKLLHATPLTDLLDAPGADEGKP